MPYISVSTTFTNGSANDAGPVNTNFAEIIAGLSDGTKDISVGTIKGNLSTNLLSSLLPTDATYDLGATSNNFKNLYLDNGATHGGRVNFNAGATSYIGADATGLIAQIVGFTSAVCPAGVSNSIAEARSRTTGTSVGVGGVAISTAASYSASASSLTDVTNLTVTIVTSGRPVRIFLASSGTTVGSISNQNLTDSVNFNLSLTVAILRGSTVISRNLFSEQSNMAGGVQFDSKFVAYPPSSIDYVDDVAAGTYTYKIQAFTSYSATNTYGFDNLKLFAYEL